MTARHAVAGLLLALWPSLAHAASFDCTVAHASIESVICGDRKLSSADDALARLYQRTLALTDPAGRRIVEDGQSAWLRYLRVACQTTPQNGIAARCIAGQMQDRARQLNGAVRSAGGLHFVERDSYGVAADTDPTRVARLPEHRYGTLALGIPYLLGPADDDLTGAVIAAWNDWIARQAQRLPDAEADGQRDMNLTYDFGLVRPELLSVVFRQDTAGHGAAHPNHTRTAANWLLHEQREIRAEDVFDPNSGWRAALGTRAAQILAGRRLRDALHPTPEQLAGRPDRWRLAEDGLTILFDPYDVAPYEAGEQDVRTPWRELKPYLAMHSPLTSLLSLLARQP